MTTTPPDGPEPDRQDEPYPPPQQPPQGYYVPAPMNRTETQLWVLGAHLGPLVLGFIAPIVVLLVVEKRSPYARRQAVEALNFQLSFFIYFIVSAFLLLLLVGLVLMVVVGVLWVVFMIVAAVQSAGGRDYGYPLTIRFIS